jgi:hypothetical protein
MAEKIKLVQGDSLPWITLTLTDTNTGLPIDLSAVGTTVRVYFRAAGEATVLSTLPCEKLNSGSEGKVRFNFAGGALNVEPGAYEGEVEVDFGGAKQTIYDVLKFTVRSQFN